MTGKAVYRVHGCFILTCILLLLELWLYFAKHPYCLKNKARNYCNLLNKTLSFSFPATILTIGKVFFFFFPQWNKDNFRLVIEPQFLVYVLDWFWCYKPKIKRSVWGKLTQAKLFVFMSELNMSPPPLRSQVLKFSDLSAQDWGGEGVGACCLTLPLWTRVSSVFLPYAFSWRSWSSIEKC